MKVWLRLLLPGGDPGPMTEATLTRTARHTLWCSRRRCGIGALARAPPGGHSRVYSTHQILGPTIHLAAPVTPSVQLDHARLDS